MDRSLHAFPGCSIQAPAKALPFTSVLIADSDTPFHNQKTSIPITARIITAGVTALPPGTVPAAAFELSTPRPAPGPKGPCSTSVAETEHSCWQPATPGGA